ncbi:hypothetical protein BMS3Abin04_01357 [bacterium BMS3Abin04]|nr:hypothetical protein BMS3Abin04_01357 [bacterium BMS3Abin04]
MPLQPIDLSKLNVKAANIYEAIIVAALEARRINSENKLEFNTLLNNLTLGAEDDFEDRDNTEQLKISLEFEKRPKPHMIALQKLLDGKIKYRYKEEEQS